MIWKLMSCLIWFLLIPEFVGIGILNFKKENKSMIFALIIGYIVEFVVFQFLAIPMIFKHLKFTTLTYSWVIIMAILTIISIIIVRKNLKEIIFENVKKLKELPKFLTIIVVIIIMIQAFIGFYYMHEDYDDSNFVAKATITLDTNTLYEYSDSGVVLSKIPSRTGLSPYPIYTALIAKLTRIHPAIIAHTVFPPVFIILAYMIYYLIAKSLFKNNNQKVMTFMLILSILFAFGGYSRYSVFGRLLYRIWQGKSMVCAIILPFIWYIFLEYIGKDNDKFYWFILFLTLWAGDLLSSIALFLLPISAGILTIIYAIKDKKPKYLMRFILCCIPTIVYGIIYVIFLQ